MQRPNPAGIRPGTVRVSPKAKLKARELLAMAGALAPDVLATLAQESVPRERETRTPEVQAGLKDAAAAKRARRAARFAKALPKTCADNTQPSLADPRMLVMLLQGTIANQLGDLKPDDVLWCLHCDKSFKVHEIRVVADTYLHCAFENCDGAGIGSDLFREPWWRTSSVHVVEHSAADLAATLKKMRGV